jgi:hypothetical protein
VSKCPEGKNHRKGGITTYVISLLLKNLKILYHESGCLRTTPGSETVGDADLTVNSLNL